MCVTLGSGDKAVDLALQLMLSSYKFFYIKETNQENWHL